ncbi:MAG: hypothetical protein S0880_31275 [Actinomycetota bacterium]|nr:hypothetical protein [Actinomycetota bacterium]
MPPTERGRGAAETLARAGGWLSHGPRLRVLGVGLFCLVALGVWWAGFYPGVMTYDSRQQWEQAEAWVFVDWHPVFHTWLIAVLTRIWFSPAIVTLAHAVALAAVLASVTRRLERARVPPAWAVVVPCLVALNPAVGLMVPLVWKDVPFAISVLWLLAEVIDLVAAPDRYLARWYRPARLVAAAVAVLGFRHNGLVIVGAVAAALAITQWRHRHRLVLVLLAVAAANLVIEQGVYRYLGAHEPPVFLSYVTFVHDMGAFVALHWDEMTPQEREFLEQVLPHERWQESYVCGQATALVVNPHFLAPDAPERIGQPDELADYPQSAFLEQHKAEFRELWFRFVRRWPGTWVDHHLGCVGTLGWLPWHLTGLEVLGPPLETMDEDLPATEPLSDELNETLTAVNAWWSDNGRSDAPWTVRWRRAVTWRAVIWCYLGLAAVGVAAWRRRDWRFLAVGAPLAAAQLSVALITPGQSTRYMFPAYLCALVCLAFFAPLRRPRADSDADTATATDIGRSADSSTPFDPADRDDQPVAGS